MKLSPRERRWIDHGIFARGTTRGAIKYGVSYMLPADIARKYRVSRRRREIAGTTLTAARRRLAKRRTQIADGDFSFLETRSQELAYTLRSFAGRYIEAVRTTKRSHGFDAACLRAVLTDTTLANCRLDDLMPGMIDRYRSRRAGEVSPKTVNHELQVLGRVLKIARQWGATKADPMVGIERLKVQQRPIRVASDDELRRLAAEAVPHLRAFILIAVNTGLRKTEILELRGTDVNLDRGFLVVRKSKNYRTRTVPLNDAVRAVLSPLVRGDFPVIQFERQPVKDVKVAWGRTCRRAGVAGLRIHDLRHTFATRWIAGGGSLPDLQAVLGHADIRETQVYAHPTTDGAVRGVNAAAFAVEGGPPAGPRKAKGSRRKT